MYHAKPFIAANAQILVNGAGVAAYSQNIESSTIAPLLEKYGLHDIDPTQWYPYQDWLNVLKELEVNLGGAASYTFVAIGRKAVETALMPADLKTIPQFLNMLNAIHQMNFQNLPPEEGYQVRQVGEKHYIIYHNTPSPDDLVYGFLWGVAARFKAPDENFTLNLIENDRPDTTTAAFELSWGQE